MIFPDLSRYDLAGIDTETTELDRTARVVGISWYTPDGRGGYLRWGHERGGNNCTFEEARAWVQDRERGLANPRLKKIFFNYIYDMRVMAYTGLIDWPALLPNCEDAAVTAPILNENEPAYSLERLVEKYLPEEDRKGDPYLDEWCAAQFGGKAWHSVQVKNYWRAPGNLVEPYAIKDAKLTLLLYIRNRALIDQEGLNRIFALETAVAPIVVNMHLAGIRVDTSRAETVKAEIQAQLRVLRQEWLGISDRAHSEFRKDDFISPSSEWAADVFTKLGIPAVGITGKGNPSVTADMLEEVMETYDEARCLLHLRQGAKMEGTFVQSYILDHVEPSGLIHIEFHPLPVEYKPGKRYGTVSGRFSSPWQNFPGDNNPKAGRTVRSLLVPYREGMRWCKGDLSQIEYRFLGHYAGGSIAQAYNENPDVDFHDMLGQMINDPTLNRTKIKRVNFGKIYGAGLKRGAELAGMSLEDWTALVAVYDRKVPEVKKINKLAMDRAKERGYITTWGGRKCRYMTADEARKKGWEVFDNERYVGCYKALNNLLQGSAADLMKKIMVRVAGDGGFIDWQNTYLHITEHDELDTSCPAGAEEQKHLKLLNEAMTDWSTGENALRVPVRAKIGSGNSWGDLVEDK